MADSRDAPTWVAVELSPAGESLIEEGLLETHLRRDLRVDENFPVFIPSVSIVRGGSRTTFHLMEGYVFVSAGMDEVVYFALEKQSYVTKILSTSGHRGLRALHTVTDKQVRGMERQLRALATAEIPHGAHVTVQEGQYRKLTGEVVGIEGDDAFIRIKMRSLDIVVTVPKVFLEEDEDSE